MIYEINRLSAAAVVPVVVLDDAKDAVATAKALLAGHGAADVLLVDVFFRDSDIVHIISTLSFCRSVGSSAFSIRSTPHLKAPARFAGR